MMPGTATALAVIGVADPYNQLPAITFWLFGSLAAIKGADGAAVAPATALGFAVLVLMRWRIGILSLGGMFVAPFERGEIGPDLFRAACRMGLEGMVSKRADRPCRADRYTHLIKVKNRKHPAYRRVQAGFEGSGQPCLAHGNYPLQTATGTIMVGAPVCRQGGRAMRRVTAVFVLATALWAVCAAAVQARVVRPVREPRTRLIVRPPVVTPYWDSYIVPRYRYRPEDDRIDPYGPPPVPVIRAGNQEIPLNWWW